MIRGSRAINNGAWLASMDCDWTGLREKRSMNFMLHLLECYRVANSGAADKKMAVP